MVYDKIEKIGRILHWGQFQWVDKSVKNQEEFHGTGSKLYYSINSLVVQRVIVIVHKLFYTLIKL